ncbi:hypothetical protein VTI74DRAFT_5063 [Chaetomium olivicolor]
MEETTMLEPPTPLTDSQIQKAKTEIMKRFFPRFGLRPARTYEFGRMARMACEAFDDEQALVEFDKYRNPTMPDMIEFPGLPKLREAEVLWRRSKMQRERLTPGRHFIVATRLKNPADYLKKPQIDSNGAYPREEILGWAEWQDPRVCNHPRGGSVGETSEDTPTPRPAFDDDDFEQTLKSLTLVHDEQAFFVPPHRSIVPLPATLESLRRAAATDYQNWKQWHEYYIPTCFGEEGDVQGQHLVLRSLVVKTPYWGDGVDHLLLEWGVRRAANHGWNILAIVSSDSIASTLSSFGELGFGELGHVDILGDTQLALVREAEHLDSGQGKSSAGLEEGDVMAKPMALPTKGVPSAVKEYFAPRELDNGARIRGRMAFKVMKRPEPIGS